MMLIQNTNIAGKEKFMEYSPWAKINKSPKEKQALVDAPVPSYNKEAVDKEIKRSKQKIGSSESKAIHSLLKGRHAQGGHINLDHCKVSTHDKNSKHKKCW
jgi:hypothetical protein